MKEKLVQLKEQLEKELTQILHYWMQHTIDDQYGGFYGKIDEDDLADGNAPKGLVLNARILWAFSAAYNHTGNKEYLVIAERAWQFITDRFWDKEFDGFYWSIDKSGNIIDGKKQVYGIAFCAYGFTEYYKAAKNPLILEQAKQCYKIIEQYSFDKGRGGYLEAFARNWQPVADLRLSPKDANEKKTMNTHLHVLEAYSNLYSIWENEELKKSIELLLENFVDHIIDDNSGHLHLFFNEDWQVKDHMISYGHDIEAAWLLWEAAVIIKEEKWIQKLKQISPKIALAASKGLDEDGGLWYEVEHGQLVYQKHSWPQAEAMVGFFNAWEMTHDEKYLDYVLNNWRFIQQYIKDKEKGEWFWGVNSDHSVMKGQDKAGFWKCPYHNTRACIEISKRIQHQLSNNNI